MPCGLKSIYRSLFPALKEMFFNRSLPGPVENPFRCLFSISFRYFVQFTRYTGSLPLRRSPALSSRPCGDSLVNITPPKGFVNPLFQKNLKKYSEPLAGRKALKIKEKLSSFNLCLPEFRTKRMSRPLSIAQTSAEVCPRLPPARFPGGNHVPPGGPLLFGSFPYCLINA